ncbi:MAG: 50S ribosomal protein L3 [Dehalococcoidia bacterium]|nr:50S ribosomal protein L3 [Dehalococcoidia bacterium]
MIHGIVGRKIGITQIFAPNGKIIATTAIEAGPCVVTQVKTKDRDGYEAVQMGFGEAKRVNAPLAGHLGKLGKIRYMKEITADETKGIEVGTRVDASLFAKGESVDVTGVSKGKGFAGGVKRYHFHGGPKTHGQSDRHRGPGSIGATTTPGRVLKGQRMAGHMGSDQVTIRNLRVLEADPARNLLLVRGSVPGPAGSMVIVHKAGKRK